jgi:two-component system cell cycle response regulator DivK
VTSSAPDAQARGSALSTQPLVLIVDDNETSLKLARDVLRADGIRTVEASTGAQAIASAVEALPDLILLDIQLPDMNGLDVVRDLRAREWTAQIPVVALTALRTADDDRWLRDAGFSGCLEKPIDTRDFPGRVRGYARRATG